MYVLSNVQDVSVGDNKVMMMNNFLKELVDAAGLRSITGPEALLEDLGFKLG